MLLLLAVLGIALASVGVVWRTANMREREAELLFVGDQFRKAIVGYRDASSGAKEYPKRLEDLIEDRRSPTVKRHLRRMFRDPMTNSMDWGFVKSGDRIVGVYSKGTAIPFRRTGFSDPYSGFSAASSYRDWIFTAEDGAKGRTSTAALPGIPPSGAPDTSPETTNTPDAAVAGDPTPTPRCVTVFNDAMENCSKSGVKDGALIQCRKAAYAVFNACSAGR